MKPEFENLKIVISDEDFLVVRSKRFYTDAFANIRNQDEITVIIDESKFRDDDFIEMEKGWRLITFDTVLGINLIGFIAEISDTLAKEGISIFVLSSYFTEHVLVKAEDLDNAVEALKKLGVKVKDKYYNGN